MWAFLKKLLAHWDEELLVLVMEDTYAGTPAPFTVRPIRILALLGGSAVGLAMLLVALTLLTPLRELFPGVATEEMRQRVRLSSLRVAALEDSLAVQQQYIARLRQLILGEVAPAEPHAPASVSPGGTGVMLPELATNSENWQEHQQPALPVLELALPAMRRVQPAVFRSDPLLQLQFPVLPPVEGFLTRGFDARRGHYGIDLAVEEGTVVRAIGSGYVIFADWTQAGGYVIIVQHADGYVSVYKHNQRLLKQMGDRVRDREAIALSGNTGEITTGPHLHFELWRHGLAQDPLNYFVIQ
ncbi:MAG: M23 family metallopeptidase [Rhodothermus sp.]|nr:M23 family metallopeptidase [Rhodothermus sp.]